MHIAFCILYSSYRTDDNRTSESALSLSLFAHRSEVPHRSDIHPISSLSGFLLEPLTSADVTLLHFSRFEWRNAKRRIRVKSVDEKEVKRRGYDTVKRRRSRNELRAKEGTGDTLGLGSMITSRNYVSAGCRPRRGRRVQ